MPELASPQSHISSLSHLLRRQPVWIILAISSGACAAINGVFAKLTTTTLTSSWSAGLASMFGLSADNNVVNFLLRAFFFGMNLLFNLAMWTLFTAALTRADSTTRVSIVNVSSNFMVTALLGWAVFGEELKGLWWVGAGCLAVGNVIIGKREEGEKPGGTSGLDETQQEAEGLMGQGEEVDLVELEEDTSRRRSKEEETRIKRGEDVDAPI
jgi:drug/metabolite transporter (DMT)-like permease